MSKYSLFLIGCVLIALPLSVYALDFHPDTIFLEADTEEECKALGGNYTTWENETYCTTLPDEEAGSASTSQTETEVVEESSSEISATDTEALRQRLIEVLKRLITLLRLQLVL